MKYEDEIFTTLFANGAIVDDFFDQTVHYETHRYMCIE